MIGSQARAKRLTGPHRTFLLLDDGISTHRAADHPQLKAPNSNYAV